MNYRVDDLYPNPDCMCTDLYPVFNTSKEHYENKHFCYTLGTSIVAVRAHVALPRDNYFFSKDFINDGELVSCLS